LESENDKINTNSDENNSTSGNDIIQKNNRNQLNKIPKTSDNSDPSQKINIPRVKNQIKLIQALKDIKENGS